MGGCQERLREVEGEVKIIVTTSIYTYAHSGINTTHNIVKKRDQLNGQFDSRKYEFRNCFHFEPLNDKMTLAGTCLISQCFE